MRKNLLWLVNSCLWRCR